MPKFAARKNAIMKITVVRYISDQDTTLSKIYIDGAFECFGLEDEYRIKKVKGDTRIPPGTYNVVARTHGGFHTRYSKTYGDFHRGMLHVKDVPGFEYILIHTGNSDEHTMGCLLVGSTRSEKIGDMKIGASVSAYKKMYPKVIEAAHAGELTIEYIDKDRNNLTENELLTAAEKESPLYHKTYTVQTGDSLVEIAQKFGTTPEKLLLKNASKIKSRGVVKGFNAGETIYI